MNKEIQKQVEEFDRLFRDEYQGESFDWILDNFEDFLRQSLHPISEQAKAETKKEIATRLQIFLTDPDEYARKNIYEYSKELEK